MRARIGSRLALTVAVVLWLAPFAASAQDTDLTYTQPPVVMLAIDTSGSMQWSGERILRDDLANLTCALGSTEKSRETVVKEVLTGTFQGYSLSVTTANASASTNGGYVDCSAGKSAANYTSQSTDGLLDNYRERLRFALSTFDNVSGTLNNGSGGDWSYPGTTSPAPLDGYVSANCGASGCSSCSCSGTCTLTSGDFNRYLCYGNVGIKSESNSPCTGSGCLISAGTPGSPFDTQNDLIQSQILSLSSSGNTPIAGMLKDIRYWFDNHPDVKVTSGSSKFVSCRQYHTIVVTDGVPNSNCGYSNASANKPEVCFRLGSCTTDSNCPFGSGPTREWSCVSGACQHVSFYEPDLASAQRAADLKNPPSGGQKSVTVHAIGFALPSAITCSSSTMCPFGQTCLPVSLLDPLGTKRCSCLTDANCDVGESCQIVPGSDVKQCNMGHVINDIAAAGGGQALFATDPTSMRTALNQIFASLTPETTSRTRPASTHYVSSLQNYNPRPGVGQEAMFLFQGAFTVPSGSPYWRGFLRRVTLGNTGTSTDPVIGPISQSFGGVHGTVQFDDLLNNYPLPTDDQGVPYSRKIYTYKNGSVIEFTTSNISPSDVGASSGSEKDSIVNFVRGELLTSRFNNRMGPVYHSSPVILEPPNYDLTLGDYNLYKSNNTIRSRPPMVFVGTSLGMIHAFNAQSGKEEWAFIPPALLLTLKNQYSGGYVPGVESTAVVRDIQLSSVGKDTDPTGLRNWRAVLVTTLGQGAPAAVALDVTNPVYSPTNDPPFRMLWQFDQTSTSPTNKLGIPWGSPVVGTVFLDDSSRGYAFQERAVAIIPGGETPSGSQGEDVWVVNLETGALIKSFAGPSGTGGMTGTCAAVDDFPGNFLTRAYCGDASGNLMRINIADAVVSNWSAQPTWHSLYDAGESVTRTPIFMAPSLALNRLGRLVILYGNGDPNDIQSLVSNRFAIIEETPSLDTGGNILGYTPTLVKRQVLTNGEKLTGTPVVYNNVAYFTTFVPAFTTSVNSCAFGQARIWAVDFDKTDSSGNFIPSLVSACGPPDPSSPFGPQSGGSFEQSDGENRTSVNCLLPVGSVSLGFDVLRTPTYSYAASAGAAGTLPGSTTAVSGGDLNLIFQTGTAQIRSGTPLYNPSLIPSGPQSIPLGSLTIADPTSRARVLSFGRVIAN